jgi:hypothetical protein
MERESRHLRKQARHFVRPVPTGAQGFEPGASQHKITCNNILRPDVGGDEWMVVPSTHVPERGPPGQVLPAYCIRPLLLGYPKHDLARRVTELQPRDVQRVNHHPDP